MGAAAAVPLAWLATMRRGVGLPRAVHGVCVWCCITGPNPFSMLVRFRPLPGLRCRMQKHVLMRKPEPAAALPHPLAWPSGSSAPPQQQLDRFWRPCSRDSRHTGPGRFSAAAGSKSGERLDFSLGLGRGEPSWPSSSPTATTPLSSGLPARREDAKRRRPNFQGFESPVS